MKKAYQHIGAFFQELYRSMQRDGYERHIRGNVLQTVVKKWFRDKDSGFLDNGGGPDIMVCKTDLVNCQFLKVGATVEFECHSAKRGLIAKKVKLMHHHNKSADHHNGQRSKRPYRPGVMT